MNSLSIVAILTLASSIGSGQSTAAAAPASPAREEMLYHWRRATVALGLDTVDGNSHGFVTIGSGVIVALDERHGCLLTARHVIFNPVAKYAPSILYLRLPKNEPSAEIDLGIPVQLVVNGTNLWKELGDGSDLAVIPLPDMSKYKDLHAVGLKDFGTDDDIYQGASIIVLGYPEILGQMFQTTPIARGGIVAWTDPDGRVDRPFLVDSNVFNGNSGGPVFHVKNGFTRYGDLNLGGGMAFIGIVSKDAVEDAPIHVGTQILGQVDPAGKPIPMVASVQNIGGIGVVEPVAKARALVESFFSSATTLGETKK